MKRQDEDFYRGIIVAATFIVRGINEPSVAADMLNEYGITKKIIMELADDYDKELLLPLFDSESIMRGVE